MFGFFSVGFWERFGFTIRKTLFLEVVFKYDFGLGKKDVRIVCRHHWDIDVFNKLSDIIVKNKLINLKDDFNTVARIAKWVNNTYPAGFYYLADKKDTWNNPLDTLESLEIRKKMIDDKGWWVAVNSKEWHDCKSTDCDDYMILIYNLCRVAGISQDKLYVCWMKTIGGWHGNVMFWHGEVPYAVEGTYHSEEIMSLFGRVPYFNISKYEGLRYCWNEDKVLMYDGRLGGVL